MRIFEYLSLVSGTQAKRVGNKKKNIVKTVHEPKKPNTMPSKDDLENLVNFLNYDSDNEKNFQKVVLLKPLTLPKEKNPINFLAMYPIFCRTITTICISVRKFGLILVLLLKQNLRSSVCCTFA
jgi:hypothetical protein